MGITNRFAEEYANALHDPSGRSKFRGGQLVPGQLDEEAVMNPVNAFLLIKRMTSDWKEIEKLMHYNMADQFIKNITDGRVLNSDYFFTLEWMNEALERNPSPQLEMEILEFLAYALYQQGNNKRALLTTKRLAELAPDHPRALC
uniref:Prolyl 4-hydroxylase alpha-subunit N-terminal domain-containing protein n=1 Tax=Meloidogyne javanica TaxID=6303 RepID=A0A915LLW5_MELJA